MTSAMPPSDPRSSVLDRYRTCEFATLSKSGVPIAWPTATLHRADGTFLITTSIALPQKAYNIRRDGRVAMLFSEPTASGLVGAPQVLVQGTRALPGRGRHRRPGDAEYWRRLHERQPFNAIYCAQRPHPAVLRLVLHAAAHHGHPGGLVDAAAAAGPAPATAPRRARTASQAMRCAELATFPQRRPAARDRGRYAVPAPHPRHRVPRRRTRLAARRAAGRAACGHGPASLAGALATTSSSGRCAASSSSASSMAGRGVDLPSRAAASGTAGHGQPAGHRPAAPGLRRTANALPGAAIPQPAAGRPGRPEDDQGSGNGASSGAGRGPPSSP